MRYCSACGTLNETDAKFCAGCGKRLGAEFEVKTEPDVTENIEDTQEIPAEEIQAAVSVPVVTAGADEPAQEPLQEQLQQPESRPDHTVKGRVFGIIGFALGIEALICCWIPYVNIITLIESIIGLIFCRISRKNTDFKLARAGKTLNLIALIFSIITIILYIVLLVILILNYGDDLAEIISQGTDGVVNITFGY